MAESEDEISELEAALRVLEASGDSQQVGLADILRTIAENGDEQAEPEYLVGCAIEVMKAAAWFVSQLQKSDDGEVSVLLANGRQLRSGWIDSDDPAVADCGDYLKVLDENGGQLAFAEAADLTDVVACRVALRAVIHACVS